MTTNGFGSAAGAFDLPPAGRLLGLWYVKSSHGDQEWPVRVEEYKRPTFEVRIDDHDLARRSRSDITVFRRDFAALDEPTEVEPQLV